MNTRSHGTSTSSNITKASCSSNRLESGLSKRFVGVEKLSRQIIFRPFAASGTQNETAYASAWGGKGREGYTAISSAKGARVASMREPLTMMPWGVSPTFRNATSLPAEGTSPFPLSIVGWTIVCVSERSRRLRNFWYFTSLSAPASLPFAPHSSDRPANPAKVTFM